MYKFTLIFLTILFSIITAQEITVLNENKINLEGKFAHASFSPDSKLLFFSSESYIGLWSYDFSSEKLGRISDNYGAGYDYAFAPNGTEVLFRADDFVSGKKFSSIVQYDFLSGERNVIAANLRNITPPAPLESGKLLFFENSQLREEGNAVNKTNNDIALLMQGYDMVLVANGKQTNLKPLGQNHYIWGSLSPAKDKILFTVPGKGTFISDIAGNILGEIGYANAPKWSPDGNFIVFMQDYDDGHKLLSSDIMVKSVDGSAEYRITNTNDRIELYPSWSPDGKHIVYNTTEGEIFVSEIKISQGE